MWTDDGQLSTNGKNKGTFFLGRDFFFQVKKKVLGSEKKVYVTDPDYFETKMCPFRYGSYSKGEIQKREKHAKIPLGNAASMIPTVFKI